jgi:hypothetical protein
MSLSQRQFVRPVRGAKMLREKPDVRAERKHMTEEQNAVAPEAAREQVEERPDERTMEFADRVARVVAELVLEAIRSGQYAGGSRLPPFLKIESCNLMGLRRRQFERFCEIMLANPTETPFRAAKQVLTELDGRGGYTRASSLQRYAGKHRRYW